MKKVVVLSGVGAIGVLVLVLVFSYSRKNAAPGRVTVTRQTITRRATSVGRIEVEHGVPVNSRNGGILTNLFVKLGQPVKAGDPLAEVRPLPTTLTLLQAERVLESACEQEEASREYIEGAHLASLATRMFMGENTIKRMHKSAVLNRRRAEEELKLLKEGKAVVENRELNYTIRAPVSGHVVSIRCREGAPVTQASMYGSGTELMALADLGAMLFRGTVNEIDVGRLTEGMPARITVGALPGREFRGQLAEIAFTSETRNNAVLFGVRIVLDQPPVGVFRSGYSAVAEIEVERRENVPALPERVVDFRSDGAYVMVPDGAGGRREQQIEAGLSDGMTVEILSGLAEGDVVLERTYQ